MTMQAIKSAQFFPAEVQKAIQYDLNRLTSVADTDISAEYSYDANGNLTQKSVNGNINWRRRYNYDWATIKSYTYTYDSYNRMISSSNDEVVTTYTYDGDNLRQSKTTNGVTTTHVYDGSDIVYEKKGNDTYVYIRGLELISSKKNDGEYEYYYHDVHGSVIAKTNSNGQTDVYEYDAFGNMESTSTIDTENPFKYCGEYVDEETGFVYLRNRYYDPSIGCFTTIDPAKDGLNWYVYCGNNPVMFSDPTGNIREPGYVNGKWTMNPDATEFDRRSSTYKILVDLGNRWNNTNDKNEKIDCII